VTPAQLLLLNSFFWGFLRHDNIYNGQLNAESYEGKHILGLIFENLTPAGVWPSGVSRHGSVLLNDVICC
jgi:hypothetical protein